MSIIIMHLLKISSSTVERLKTFLLYKRALNFTVLVDGFIDIIILHVVFSNLYVIREKTYIFTIWPYWLRLWS